MTAILRNELQPHLCAFLDMVTLAKRADCLASPEVPAHRISMRDHHVPFLIIEHVTSRKMVIALPLVSYYDADVDQEALDQNCKQRGGIGWLKRVSYFQPKDGWAIPDEAFLIASFPEMSKTEERMRYARGRPQEMARIRKLAFRDIGKMVPVWATSITIPRRERVRHDNEPGPIAMSETWGASYGRGAFF